MSPPTSRKILIIGGGPAGATAAYFLAQAGFHITIAERSTSKFTFGQGIDITGPAISVIRHMDGVYDTVRSNTTKEKGFRLLDDAGNSVGYLPAAEEGEKGKGFSLTQDLEIMRGDLTRILADAAKAQGDDKVEYRYGCSVDSLTQHSTHVTAMLRGSNNASETTEDFAAIIGADGQNSKVRSLAFSPDQTKDCYHPIADQYSAFFSIPGLPSDSPDALLQHGVGSRTILLRPTRADSNGSARCSCYLVLTKHDAELEESVRSRRPGQQDQQKAIYERIFAAFPGSLKDRALAGMREASDFYVAATAQIKLPAWSSDRVVLAGDAAYAPSPVTGQGTALAIVGSYVIAGELARTPDDPQAAFKRYEERLREYVSKAQQLPGGPWVPKLANPETMWGIAVLRWVFWAVACSGIYKLFGNIGSGNPLELEEYEFRLSDVEGEEKAM